MVRNVESSCSSGGALLPSVNRHCWPLGEFRPKTPQVWLLPHPCHQLPTRHDPQTASSPPYRPHDRSLRSKTAPEITVLLLQPSIAHQVAVYRERRDARTTVGYHTARFEDDGSDALGRAYRTSASPRSCKGSTYTICCPPLPGVIQSQTNQRLGFATVLHYNASAVVKLGVVARRCC